MDRCPAHAFDLVQVESGRIVSVIAHLRIEEAKPLASGRTEPDKLVALRSGDIVRIAETGPIGLKKVDFGPLGIREDRIFRAPAGKGTFNHSQNAKGVHISKGSRARDDGNAFFSGRRARIDLAR